jgi:hypothetical protein
MDAHLLAFAESVKLTECRIVHTPNLIFLCGGRTSDPKLLGPYVRWTPRLRQSVNPLFAVR